MEFTNLKEKLINKIQEIDDAGLLKELSVLFELNEPDTVYQLSDEQKDIIAKSKEEIKSNQFLTNEEADKDIDEWLNK